MTRNAKGVIVPQCKEKYVSGVNHARCVREEDHKGAHVDARGNWDRQGAATPGGGA